MHSSKHTKSDLQKYVLLLHSSIKTLTTTLGIPDELLSGASWRFPEKLARDLDIEHFLTLDGTDEKMKLELIIDRFVLLLQVCLLIFDKKSTLPLTLSSTVKKFIRQQIKQRDSSQQTSTTTVGSNISIRWHQKATKLRDGNSDSQLHYSAASSAASSDHTITTLSTIDNTVTTLTADDNKTSPVLTALSTVDNTMIALMADNRNYTTSSPQSVDVSVQTLETSLTACSSCSALMHRVETNAQKVASLCSTLQLPSQIQMTNWKLLIEAERMDQEKLASAIDNDLSTIKKFYDNLQVNWSAKVNQLESKLSIVSELKEQCDTLKKHIESLQHDLECARRYSQDVIQDNKQKMAFEVNEYKNLLSKEYLKNGALSKEITDLKIKENDLKLVQIEKDKELKNVIKSLQQSQHAERQLYKLKDELEEQLAITRGEQEQVSKLLEEKDIELRKATSHLCNLETRCKTIQAKHNNLLMHIDELDQKCDKLSNELVRVEKEKSDISSELARVTDNIKEMEHKLEREQENSEKIEKHKLILQASLGQMEQDLAAVMEQQKVVEKEKENLELLIEDSAPVDPTQFQSISNSRRAINANTVRIMLLEQQNKELRQISINDIADKSKGFEIKKPVQLWQPHVVSSNNGQNTSMYSRCNQDITMPYHRLSTPESVARKAHSQPIPSNNLGKTRPSSTLLNGVKNLSVNDSSLLLYGQTPPSSSLLSNASSYQQLQTYSCTNCDRMFCSQHDLQDHSKSSCN